MFLADLGAEVIKIENVGDAAASRARTSARIFLGEDDSEYFQTFNTNKKSVTLDLKTRRRAARRSAGWLQPPTPSSTTCAATSRQSWGSTTRRLKAVNPAVVCLHISAYGRDNERKAGPATTS